MRLRIVRLLFPVALTGNAQCVGGCIHMLLGDDPHRIGSRFQSVRFQNLAVGPVGNADYLPLTHQFHSAGVFGFQRQCQIAFFLQFEGIAVLIVRRRYVCLNLAWKCDHNLAVRFQFLPYLSLTGEIFCRKAVPMIFRRRLGSRGPDWAQRFRRKAEQRHNQKPCRPYSAVRSVSF